MISNVHLSALCDYADGRIGVSDLDTHSYISTENMLPNKEGICQSSGLPVIAQTQAYQPNDVLVSNIRPYFRKIWFADRIGGCSNDVLVMRAKQNCYPRFLYYILSDDKFFDYSTATGKGTKMPRGDKNAIMCYTVPDIPFEDQKKIANTLSALDDRITENKKINHHLEQMAQAIFKSWFDCYDPSQPFTNAVQVLGGGTPKTGNESYWNGEIPFFTPKDTGSLYVLSTEKRLSEAGLSNCNSRLYPVNTVFVTARETVGKLALAGCPMAMNQSCYALVSNGDYGQFYVYHLALTVVEKLKRKANGAVFDAIVTRDFETELVPAPATKEIKAFEDKIQPIFETILNNCKENVRLAELRDTLLPRLMSGELSVADLGDGK